MYDLRKAIDNIVINRLRLNDQTSEILARSICNFDRMAKRFVLLTK